MRTAALGKTLMTRLHRPGGTMGVTLITMRVPQGYKAVGQQEPAHLEEKLGLGTTDLVNLPWHIKTNMPLYTAIIIITSIYVFSDC